MSRQHFLIFFPPFIVSSFKAPLLRETDRRLDSILGGSHACKSIDVVLLQWRKNTPRRWKVNNKKNAWQKVEVGRFFFFSQSVFFVTICFSLHPADYGLPVFSIVQTSASYVFFVLLPLPMISDTDGSKWFHQKKLCETDEWGRKCVSLSAWWTFLIHWFVLTLVIKIPNICLFFFITKDYNLQSMSLTHQSILMLSLDNYAQWVELSLSSLSFRLSHNMCANLCWLGTDWLCDSRDLQ